MTGPLLGSQPTTVGDEERQKKKWAKLERKLGIQIRPRTLHWIGCSWTPGGSYRQRLTIQNISTTVQKVHYRCPKETVFYMEYPEVITLTAGMTAHVDVYFRPVKNVAVADVLEFYTESGGGPMPIELRASLPETGLSLPAGDLVDFEFQPTEEVAKSHFQLRNVGQLPLDVQLSTDDPFFLPRTSLSQFPDGSETAIEVHFRPHSAGHFHGKVKIVVPSSGQEYHVRLVAVSKFPCLAWKGLDADNERMVVNFDDRVEPAETVAVDGELGGSGRFTGRTESDLSSPTNAKTILTMTTKKTVRSKDYRVMVDTPYESSEGSGTTGFSRLAVDNAHRTVTLQNRSAVVARWKLEKDDKDITTEFASPFVVTPSSGELAPGAECTVQIHFRPHSAAYRYAGHYRFTTVGGRAIELHIGGTGHGPRISASEKIIDFGDVRVGELIRRRITFYNESTLAPADCEIDLPANAAPGIVVGGVFSVQGHRSDFTMNRGFEHTVVVCFRPSDPINFVKRVRVLVRHGSPITFHCIGSGFDSKRRPSPVRPFHLDTERLRQAAQVARIPPDLLRGTMRSMQLFLSEDPAPGEREEGGERVILSSTEPGEGGDDEDDVMDVPGGRQTPVYTEEDRDHFLSVVAGILQISEEEAERRVRMYYSMYEYYRDQLEMNPETDQRSMGTSSQFTSLDIQALQPPVYRLPLPQETLDEIHSPEFVDQLHTSLAETGGCLPAAQRLVQVSTSTIAFSGDSLLSTSAGDRVRSIDITNTCGGRITCVFPSTAAAASNAASATGTTGPVKSPVFEFSPREFDLNPGEKKTVQVYFRPHNDRCYYGSDQELYVYWKTQRSFRLVNDTFLAIPHTFSLSLVGHTFPASLHDIPQYQLRILDSDPQHAVSTTADGKVVLEMTPTRPGRFATRTLMLSNEGDTAFVYHFQYTTLTSLSPGQHLLCNHPHFVVPPHSQRQVSWTFIPAPSLSLSPPGDIETASSSPRLACALLLNYHKAHPHTLSLRMYSQLPHLSPHQLEGSVVYGRPTQLGTSTEISVPLRNPTGVRTRVRVLIPPEWRRVLFVDPSNLSLPIQAAGASARSGERERERGVPQHSGRSGTSGGEAVLLLGPYERADFALRFRPLSTANYTCNLRVLTLPADIPGTLPSSTDGPVLQRLSLSVQAEGGCGALSCATAVVRFSPVTVGTREAVREFRLQNVVNCAVPFRVFVMPLRSNGDGEEEDADPEREREREKRDLYGEMPANLNPSSVVHLSQTRGTVAPRSNTLIRVRMWPPAIGHYRFTLVCVPLTGERDKDASTKLSAVDREKGVFDDPFTGKDPFSRAPLSPWANISDLPPGVVTVQLEAIAAHPSVQIVDCQAPMPASVRTSGPIPTLKLDNVRLHARQSGPAVGSALNVADQRRQRRRLLAVTSALEGMSRSALDLHAYRPSRSTLWMQMQCHTLNEVFQRPLSLGTIERRHEQRRRPVTFQDLANDCERVVDLQFGAAQTYPADINYRTLAASLLRADIASLPPENRLKAPVPERLVRLCVRNRSPVAVRWRLQFPEDLRVEVEKWADDGSGDVGALYQDQAAGGGGEREREREREREVQIGDGGEWLDECMIPRGMESEEIISVQPKAGMLAAASVDSLYCDPDDLDTAISTARDRDGEKDTDDTDDGGLQWLEFRFRFPHAAVGKRVCIPAILEFDCGVRILLRLQGDVIAPPPGFYADLSLPLPEPPRSPVTGGPEAPHLWVQTLNENVLRPVRIGADHPPVQYLSVWNPLPYPVAYALDPLSFDAFRSHNYGFDVLHCPQPTGTLSARRETLIPLVFQPLETGKYTLTIPLRVSMPESGNYRPVLGSVKGWISSSQLQTMQGREREREGEGERERDGEARTSPESEGERERDGDGEDKKVAEVSRLPPVQQIRTLLLRVTGYGLESSKRDLLDMLRGKSEAVSLSLPPIPSGGLAVGGGEREREREREREKGRGAIPFEMPRALRTPREEMAPGVLMSQDWFEFGTVPTNYSRTQLLVIRRPKLSVRSLIRVVWVLDDSLKCADETVSISPQEVTLGSASHPESCVFVLKFEAGETAQHFRGTLRAKVTEILRSNAQGNVVGGGVVDGAKRRVRVMDEKERRRAQQKAEEEMDSSDQSPFPDPFAVSMGTGPSLKMSNLTEEQLAAMTQRELLLYRAQHGVPHMKNQTDVKDTENEKSIGDLVISVHADVTPASNAPESLRHSCTRNPGTFPQDVVRAVEIGESVVAREGEEEVGFEEHLVRRMRVGKEKETSGAIEQILQSVLQECVEDWKTDMREVDTAVEGDGERERERERDGERAAKPAAVKRIGEIDIRGSQVLETVLSARSNVSHVTTGSQSARVIYESNDRLLDPTYYVQWVSRYHSSMRMRVTSPSETTSDEVAIPSSRLLGDVLEPQDEGSSSRGDSGVELGVNDFQRRQLWASSSCADSGAHFESLCVDVLSQTIRNLCTEAVRGEWKWMRPPPKSILQ